MASKNLTIKQATVVVTIRNFKHLHGYTPSIRDIATAMDRARGTIVQHIHALERKGIIRRTPKIARSIEILTAA
jgi:SOS-response transcriptional repressor LexA